MTRIIQIYITKEELLEFSLILKVQRENHGIDQDSLNLEMFIKKKRRVHDSEDLVYQGNLGQVTLADGESIDLRGADLSFIRFCDDVVRKTFIAKQWQLGGFFNSKTGELKQVTNLQGAFTPSGCEFHDMKFAGSDWGKKILNSSQFKMCNFRGSIYDPSLPQIMTVKVGTKELRSYLALRRKSPVHASARASFSEYLSYTKRHLCSDNTKIVADLSGVVIDGVSLDLNGADLTGSILQGTQFKNITATGVIIRDCETSGMIIENSHFSALDLRGSEVAKIKFTDNTRLDSPKFSTGTLFSSFIGVGSILDKFVFTPLFDPCYLKGQVSAKLIDGKIVANIPDVTKYHPCTVDDIKEYAQQCQENKSVTSNIITSANDVLTILPSFREFLRAKYKIVDDFVPDASNLNLDDLDLSYSNWGRCNWNGCIMIKTKWDYSNLESSYFGRTLFSGHKPTFRFLEWLEGKAYHTSFVNTNLEGAIFDESMGRYADFSNAIMNYVSAIDCDLRQTIFDGVKAIGSVFSGTFMMETHAHYLDATRAIFCGVSFHNSDAYRATFNEAKLDFAVFDNANLSEVKARYVSALSTSFHGADVTGGDLTGTKLWANISRMKLGGTKLDHVDMSEAIIDISMLFGRYEPECDDKTKCTKIIDGEEALKIQKIVCKEKQYTQKISDSSWRRILFNMSKSLDWMCGGEYFKRSAAIIIDLSDNMIITGVCIISSPILLHTAGKIGLEFVLGSSISSFFMGSVALPLGAVGVCAGVATAMWLTRAGQDSQDIKDVAAKYEKYMAIHSKENQALKAKDVVPQSITKSISKALGRKHATEHGKHTARISEPKAKTPKYLVVGEHTAKIATKSHSAGRAKHK